MATGGAVRGRGEDFAQPWARVRHRVRAAVRRPPDPEATLSACCHDYVEDGRRGLRYFALRPWTSITMVSAAMRLPTLCADLSDSPEAVMMRRRLSRTSFLGRTALHRATAVLVLPQDPQEYLVGRSKMTLRRKVRQALSMGVHWKSIGAVEQRERFLAMARNNEQSFAGGSWRSRGRGSLFSCR